MSAEPLGDSHIRLQPPQTNQYHLARAVYQDRLPEDAQTCKDYGFDKAFTPQNRSNLLGLYQGLLNNFDLNPKTLHKWRVQGTLVEEIKRMYEEIPEQSCGIYYPWFLQNQYVLDPSLDPPDFPHQDVMRAWQYAGGTAPCTEAEILATKLSWPSNKRTCYDFCQIILAGWSPSPDLAMWLLFGFCVCRLEHEESHLAQLYLQLIAKCSFDEFYTAYDSSALIHLFEANGLRLQLKGFRHLEDVLAHSPQFNKSVWDLKQMVMTEDGSLIPSVNVDYGFVNCEVDSERLALRAVYKRYFEDLHADPIMLHEAAIGGKIFEYIGGFLKLKKKERKTMQRLMKNPYPLQI